MTCEPLDALGELQRLTRALDRLKDALQAGDYNAAWVYAVGAAEGAVTVKERTRVEFHAWRALTEEETTR